MIRIIGHHRFVFCDALDCGANTIPAEGLGPFEDARSFRVARLVAEDRGWLTTADSPGTDRTGDFCPTHKAQIECADLEANDA